MADRYMPVGFRRAAAAFISTLNPPLSQFVPPAHVAQLRRGRPKKPASQPAKNLVGRLAPLAFLQNARKELDVESLNPVPITDAFSTHDPKEAYVHFCGQKASTPYSKHE